MRTLILLSALVLALGPFVHGQAPGGLLIRNGLVVDGTGAPGRVADVRVTGDAIADVGAGLAPRPGERIIDANGLVVAPGFIDMHSHAGDGIADAPDASSQVRQGITTALVGQDGGGDLPVSSFFDEVERIHPAINFAASVGHGTVRQPRAAGRGARGRVSGQGLSCARLARANELTL